MDTQKSRKKAFELLYEIEIKKELSDKVTSEVLGLFCEKEPVGEGTFEYISKIIVEANDKKAEIEDFIKSNLKDWTYDRIPKIAIAATKLVICEIATNEKINPKIAVSEAIKILSEYEDEKTIIFVNGLLATFIKSL